MGTAFKTQTRNMHSLPKLAYAYNALEPSISAQIMEIHHSKHHNTYVTNDTKKQIALQAALKFNGGGHLNHSLFWTNLSPASEAGGKFPSSGPLADAVKEQFGGLDGLKKEMTANALAIQGSGWTWLGYNSASKRLEVSSTANQDPLLSSTPLVGIDMWEHAYYLQYQNGKAAYLDNIWAVMNWGEAEKRMGGAGKL